jgi:hypothetical protein
MCILMVGCAQLGGVVMLHSAGASAMMGQVRCVKRRVKLDSMVEDYIRVGAVIDLFLKA